MTGDSNRSGARGEAWAVVQLVLLAAVVASGLLWNDQWEAGVTVTVGRVFLILSGAFALSGFVALGRNLTPFPKPRVGATLVRHGIYAFVRHPLYLGLILGAFGWGMVRCSAPALAVAAALALFLNAKARVEERWLRQQFPEYTDYARRVRRFIPVIY